MATDPIASAPSPARASGSVRIIPRLDIKGPNLVKGIHLEGLRVLGKPEAFARHYYEHGADELLFMDVVASLYERNSLLDLIRRIAHEIFVPLAVGGGIRSIDDIRAVLRAGGDKVSLNTAAVRRPEFIREAARKFGSSTIVVSIEAIRRGDGSYEAYTDNGRERTGLDVFEWAARAAELGAGEIIVTSIDREGTGSGFDLDLTRRISQALPIPVIACGGAGTPEHVWEVATAGRAQAVSVASMLHYDVVRQRGLIDEFDPMINTAHLQENRGFGRISEVPLPAIKRFLLNRGVVCRPVERTA
jgi:imidazole glycerol-phosphate synthase subunit HisF